MSKELIGGERDLALEPITLRVFYPQLGPIMTRPLACPA